MLAVVGLGVAAGMTLTACGGGDGAGSSSGKGVDTLQSGAPAGKSTASKGGAHDSAVDAKRPQLRLDTSLEEEQRLSDAYNACLQAHGVPMNTERAAAAGAKQAAPKVSEKDNSKYQAAYDACLVKLPLRPPETSPETNAHYADDYRAYVKCLQHRGMKIHLISDTSVYPDGLGWTYDDDTTGSLPESKETEADRACLLEAFSDK
ncbi:hypothetical protein BIV24_08525 [Streptomyces colonosanans]|uniref:Uncharacterized protein n=1 Tax=Streptomyces colonosanans TaxID=1428652 RepID=A0A1S2PQ89_9ACTN|nr:hypothetical protein BIV24_08525 [Streptomyces colonosanans]